MGKCEGPECLGTELPRGAAEINFHAEILLLGSKGNKHLILS